MRKLIPFTAVLVALAVSDAGGKAPVPKDKPPPAIDGKYLLLVTYSGAAAVAVRPALGRAENEKLPMPCSGAAHGLPPD